MLKWISCLIVLGLILLTATGIFENMHRTAGISRAHSSVNNKSPKPHSDIILKTTASSVNKAPLFNGTLVNGQTASLKSFLKHEPVLLNMWSTTCGECQEDLVILQNIQKKISPMKIKIVTVNMTSEEYSVKDVRNFVEKSKLGFPVFLDKKGEIMKKYHVYGIPTSYLIDPNGEVIHEFRGVVNLSELKQWLPSRG